MLVWTKFVIELLSWKKKQGKEIYASTSNQVGLEQMQNGKVINP